MKLTERRFVQSHRCLRQSGHEPLEVKTKTNDAFGAPGPAVTPQSQRRMVKTAPGCIKRRKFLQVPCRFNVVTISAATEKEVEFIQNACEIDWTRW